jgi:hypothetical protein
MQGIDSHHFHQNETLPTNTLLLWISPRGLVRIYCIIPTIIIMITPDRIFVVSYRTLKLLYPCAKSLSFAQRIELSPAQTE